MLGMVKGHNPDFSLQLKMVEIVIKSMHYKDLNYPSLFFKRDGLHTKQTFANTAFVTECSIAMAIVFCKKQN
jgi:hypothetical protein